MGKQKGNEINPVDSGEITFHYTREERDTMHRRLGRNRVKTGIFKRNPGLMIVFFDLLFIALIIFLIIPFVRERVTPSPRLQGYVLELSAFYYAEEIYTTLSVTADEPSEKSENEAMEGDFDAESPLLRQNEGGIITVLFQTEGEEEKVVIEELLPPPGARRDIRARLPGSEGDTVSARITIHGQDLTVEKKAGK